MPQNKAQTKTELFIPNLYSVILHNDDSTTMDFVVDIIVSIFGKNFDDAMNLMLKIHNEGLAVCGSYEKEIAITKQKSVLNAAKVAGFPLKCTVEKE
ncbi:MAG: ATP-dependent Clp protease adaptor ClpS [Campylobacter sp.]|nr:ATP-dependent Clp protease adaptor ClpS [Campylobacter sp.]